MNIIFAASECVPFVKTGGLADVMGALPKAVAQAKGKKNSAATILPKYSLIDRSHEMELLPGRILVPVGSRLEQGFVWKLKSETPGKGVAHYFIENKRYYDRPSLYRDGGKDFVDNDERYIFYARGVLEACKLIGFRPDLIHSHDWQAGLIPAYLRTLYRTDAFFHRTATLFTIHNIAYQGLFPALALETAGFDPRDFVPDRLEYYGQFSFLKAGLVYADKLSTVSPTYAKEVQKSAAYGRGMEGVLRSRAKDFEGILNGLDYDTWDPARDPHIAGPFSLKSKNLKTCKAACKSDLQKTAHLPQNSSIPLIGMVSRLDAQKGFDMALEVIAQLIKERVPAQWSILGQGEPALEEKLLELARRYPQQVSVELAFNDPLAHKIYAGADFFLMPSVFEPCGLSQMISMSYGTVPVVTPTGGLLDTVRHWNPAGKQGNGIMSDGVSLPAVRKAVDQALQLFRDPVSLDKLIRNAMKTRFTWEDSARAYLALYQKAAAAVQAGNGVVTAR